MEQLTFLYTAFGIFNKTYYKDGNRWEKYIQWSNLKQLVEVVSLDRMLNETLFEPDYDNAADWNFIHTSAKYITGFFTTVEYVLRKCENLKCPRKFWRNQPLLWRDYTLFIRS